MKQIILQIAGIVLLFGTCIVPPWDIPENAICEAQIEAQAEETEEAEQVDENELIVDESGENEPEMEYIGTFTATAYEWTGSPCANGEFPTEGYTIACNSLPLGTEVYIEGIGYRVVEDRGAEWHGDSWLDIYMGDEASCYEWGVREIEVYIVR